MITPRGEGEPGADLIAGNYLIRFVARDVDDVRAIVGTDPEDERRFAAAARISEINLGLYRSFLQPLVRATVSEPLAEWMRRMHPLRLQYELLSDQNPMMRPLAGLAERVREERKPAAADNSLAKLEAEVSHQIEAALDGYRDLRDRWYEQVFLAVYGSPLLQALVGLRARDEPPRRRPGDDPDHLDFVARRKAELLDQIGAGGLREASLRALLYVLMPQRATDERTFNLLAADARGARRRHYARRVQGRAARAGLHAPARPGAGRGDLATAARERVRRADPRDARGPAPRRCRQWTARRRVRGPARGGRPNLRGGGQGGASGTARDRAGASGRAPSHSVGGLMRGRARQSVFRGSILSPSLDGAEDLLVLPPCSRSGSLCTPRTGAAWVPWRIGVLH